MPFDAELEKPRVDLELTEWQVANLHKLATFLLTLPDDAASFDMTYYVWKDKVQGTYLTEATECGSVGCAVGHGPKIGIKPKIHESWTVYAQRCFSGNMWKTIHLNQFMWCFSAEWAERDNTPSGAAKRILWMLTHGVPEDASLQRLGGVPLCYKES